MNFQAVLFDMDGVIVDSEPLHEPVEIEPYMREKAEVYLELAAGQLTPYPGVIELIESLATQNIPLALVTGSLRAEAAVTLETFHISHHFAAVIAAEDIARSKPNPEGYEKAAAKLHVSPDQCIVIEDAPSGVAAAKAAGMRCLAVTTTHLADELAGATATVGQLSPGCLDSL